MNMMMNILLIKYSFHSLAPPILTYEARKWNSIQWFLPKLRFSSLSFEEILNSVREKWNSNKSNWRSDSIDDTGDDIDRRILRTTPNQCFITNEDDNSNNNIVIMIIIIIIISVSLSLSFQYYYHYHFSIILIIMTTIIIIINRNVKTQRSSWFRY